MAPTETRKLSIFLYNVTTQPTFALHYLVTPLTGKDKDNHSLLEAIIHVFSATSTIANSGFMVKLDSLSLDELSKLWIALGAPLRVCISLTLSAGESPPQHDSQIQVTTGSAAVHTGEIDTNQAILLYQLVLKTFTEQSSDWKNRNIVVRQWVLQDFKKNTNSSADEMLIELNNLGDKLRRGEPTAQFMKTLNLLAGYYRHQLDELKGMQKVTHKQKENLEMISQWVKDVENLLKFLGS